MFNRLMLKAKQAFFSPKPAASYSAMALQKKYPHVITEQQRNDILAAANASQAYLMGFLKILLQ